MDSSYCTKHRVHRKKKHQSFRWHRAFRCFLHRMMWGEVASLHIYRVSDHKGKALMAIKNKPFPFSVVAKNAEGDVIPVSPGTTVAASDPSVVLGPVAADGSDTGTASSAGSFTITATDGAIVSPPAALVVTLDPVVASLEVVIP